jgi:N-acetylneuraminic acid mutarotase
MNTWSYDEQERLKRSSAIEGGTHMKSKALLKGIFGILLVCGILVFAACEIEPISGFEDDYYDSGGFSLSWEQVGSLPYAAEGIRASVINDKIVVTTGNLVMTSIDGRTWDTAAILPETIYNDRHQSLIFNNKLFVIGGFFMENNNDEYFSIGNKVSSSPDGSTFNLLEPVSGLNDGIWYHSAASFEHAMWVFGGFTDTGADNGIETNAVWKSTDGKTWIQQYSSGFSARCGHATTVYHGKLYTAGGYSDTELQDVLVSLNGTSWATLVSKAPWVKRNDHTLTANSKGLWLAGGNGGDNAKFLKDVWFSSDGRIWEEVKNIPFAVRAGHASVIKDGYLYIIGGCNGSWDNPTLLNDVWRAYVGGSDTNEGSSSIQTAKLIVTNKSSYPIKSLYLFGGSILASNWLPSNLAVNASFSVTLDQGSYTVLVYDTQNRYQSFSVSIGATNVTRDISNANWTSPPVTPPSYTWTIKNNHSYEITGVYIRKSGVAGWGQNRISSVIGSNGSRNVGSFESGLYDIQVVSKIRVQRGNSGAGSRRPAAAGANTVSYPTAYLIFSSQNLNVNKTITVGTSGWTIQ